ncbi:MAG TPA: site-specific DNA-methyltransferase, partial [Pyrinomonadaceae bacterium]|nr:site-specific DNA-methyltransferase [Pyrinomonadaceae bacterium]
LYYTKGNPTFNVEAEYTDIPKILRGYYKEVNGNLTENLQRGKSDNIRAGNVWVDIQQVFYRMEENVSGCYAQKPLKAIERILRASSNKDNLVIDFFAHSGTTLLAAELLDRKCYTTDIDPIYCEVSIRRLERYRQTRKLGWQNGHPFEHEVALPIPDSQSETAESQQSFFQDNLFDYGKTTSRA